MLGTQAVSRFITTIMVVLSCLIWSQSSFASDQEPPEEKPGCHCVLSAAGQKCLGAYQWLERYFRGGPEHLFVKVVLGLASGAAFIMTGEFLSNFRDSREIENWFFFHQSNFFKGLGVMLFYGSTLVGSYLWYLREKFPRVFLLSLMTTAFFLNLHAEYHSETGTFYLEDFDVADILSGTLAVLLFPVADRFLDEGAKRAFDRLRGRFSPEVQLVLRENGQTIYAELDRERDGR